MKKILLTLFISGITAVVSGNGSNAEDQMDPVTERSIEEKPDVKKIRLNTGVTLDYVEQGDPAGLPIIFLHGITDSWHSYETVLPELPKWIHAFAITQRGHGDSEKPQTGCTSKDFAADVAAFIEQKKLGKAIVVGHSMGGVNAQQFALSYPHLLKALVIIGSDPSIRKNPGLPEFLETVNGMKGSIEYSFMEGFQRETLHNPIDSAYFQTVVKEGMKTPLPVFKQALAGLMNVDFSEQLPGIKQPVLILWGDKDSFCRIEGQKVLRSKLPQARSIVYENIGHAVHWEVPGKVAQDLVQFINSQGLR